MKNYDLNQTTEISNLQELCGKFNTALRCGQKPVAELSEKDRLARQKLDFYSQFISLGDLCFDVGANTGNRTEIFLKLGAKVIAVEPQDDCVKYLKESYGRDKNLTIIQKVLGKSQGLAELMICNANVLSSLSPEWVNITRKSGRFSEYSWDKTQTVSMITLDQLVEEYGVPAFAKIDVEGFEYEVLKGLSRPLKALSMEFTPEFLDSTFKCIEHLQSLGRIQLNYSLNETMQLVSDKWISPEEMVETLKNFRYDNRVFGDVYVKFIDGFDPERKAADAVCQSSRDKDFDVKAHQGVQKPVITMSTLGENGRFANQIFQYAFLKIYARQHGLEVMTPSWAGQDLFGHKDPPITQKLPEVRETTNELATAVVPNSKERFENVDFWGYFQYHTRYYLPHKEYFRSLFRPVTELEKPMNQAIERFRSKAKTLVGLHLRRADYGQGHFYLSPNEWYKKWLQCLWPCLDSPALFIASDEIENVVKDFAEYNPLTAADFGVKIPQYTFYPDFYMLSKCDAVAISNSSFSFLACMLNEQGRLFYRPKLSLEKLVSFDPWDDDPVYFDEGKQLILTGRIQNAFEYFAGTYSLSVSLAQKQCRQAMMSLDDAALRLICSEAHRKMITDHKHKGAGLLLSCAESQLNARELFGTGLEHLKSENYAESMDCFDRAEAVCSEIPDLHFARAATLSRLGHLDKAVDACRAGLLLQSNHQPTLALLGKLSTAIAQNEVSGK